MALFLIHDRDNTHSDPVKSATRCHKLGDIVVVYEDSKHDGNIVANPISPPWYIVKVIGLTKEQALKYATHYIDPATLNDPEPQLFRRRKYCLEVANLSLPIRNQLSRDRYLEVDWSQIRAFVRNKETGLTE